MGRLIKNNKNQKSNKTTKSREHHNVVVEDLDEHPWCPHGPTLLFTKNLFNDKTIEKFYACSACRDQTNCKTIYKTIDDINKIKYGRNKLFTQHEKLHERFVEIKNHPTTERYYCINCNSLLSSTDTEFLIHKLNHKIITKLSDYLLDNPTNMLMPLNNDKKEAQYFFTEETLTCFENIFTDLKLTKIICMGAPRLFEFLKRNFCKLKIKCILLDIDKRFELFLSPKEFCSFNMFNNYFFNGEKSREIFTQFLHCDKNDRIGLFTDPPFGCRTEPLVHTIKLIAKNYQAINKTFDFLTIFWIYPYFMEIYIKNDIPEIEMSDYQINYTNHSKYNKKNISPIRLFTNINLADIKLPAEENYKFCSKCKRYVYKNNNHCDKCKKCPSKNGRIYKHCLKCCLCVKSTYNHCDNCNRCIQPHMPHNCFEYQKNLLCYLCRCKGHIETNCEKWLQMQKQNKCLLKISKNKRKHCLLCSKNDHNELNCKNRKTLLNEKCFLSKYTNLLN